MEVYNVNFLLTNENEERTNQLLDSFINIYAKNLVHFCRINSLNISPNHHFLEEFKDFIENYAEIEKYLSSGALDKLMLIEGIKAVNVLYGNSIQIYINPFVEYMDENVASFGFGEKEEEFARYDESQESVFYRLSNMELEIVDYGMVKGAEKVMIPEIKR